MASLLRLPRCLTVLATAPVQTPQVFECTFEKNFLSIFVDVLMSGVSQQTRSLIISSSFVLPWIVTILIAPLVTRFGTRNVIFCTFCLKVALSGVALTVGYRRPLFIGVFAIVSRILTECVCRLNPLVLADLVDEDKALHNRARTMSAMVIGTNSFFTKPGESLAPMLGWAVVNSGGDGGAGIAAGEGMQATLFYCLVCGPLVLATMQLVCWSLYSLHGSYLEQIKETVHGMDRDVGMESGGLGVEEAHRGRGVDRMYADADDGKGL